MRLLKINLLVAALMVLGAATSSAYRVDMVSAEFGTSINPGQLVTIAVDFDSEGATDVAILGMGVLFNESVFSYRQDLSSTTSYLLYTTGKNPFLIANAVCGGYGGPTAGDGCTLFGEGTSGFISNQVGIAHNSSSSTLAGVPAVAPAGTQLVQLVFEATGGGTGSFDFDFDLARGGILQLGTGERVALGLGASGSVNVIPEPTTALLVGLGLVGLGVAGRRSRS
ncbi:MAG: PEP-CTERM sorting domain-containing protein [Deltaproteobacteria bacterium]|nr:PEP-CTERM sorting domain-containing protein [Deltaproteobacteria bacterium]MBW2384132.1 PEP-CTERM sorting domain-containing protein [Deltaproteobacteria bacterium]MBW2697616.1 PEP-CTERM sorting domain-containing protein [Deltaproteobacteria bacterium]